MIDVGKITEIFDSIFPKSGVKIVDVEDSSARIIMEEKKAFLRPGNTVAGPVLMMLADTVVYIAILGKFGEDGMHFVTSNLNINFLARVHPGDITAVAKLVKAGSRLVTADVEIFDQRDQMVAKATVNYMAVLSAR